MPESADQEQDERQHEEQKAAQPVTEAVSDAMREVEDTAAAEAAVEALEAEAGDKSAEAVLAAEKPKEHAGEAARQVEQAGAAAPAGRQAAKVLTETTRAAESAHGPAQEALADAAQAALAPEREAAEPTTGTEPQRALLRQALLKRLGPLQAVDARLFLWINHLPHTALTNGVFRTLTTAFHGGAAWYVFVGAAMLAQGRWSQQWWRDTVIPLTAASAIVEGPVKSYFKRRRPFIDLVRAIVIGKKPGTWSFPSGHSATAFAGAYLLRRHFPRFSSAFYIAAALVAFSRVYLGVHYPGDVVTGSIAGGLLARALGWLLPRVWVFRRRG